MFITKLILLIVATSVLLRAMKKDAEYIERRRDRRRTVVNGTE